MIGEGFKPDMYRDKQAPDVFRPGLYRHYKGGLYTAISLVTHHEGRHPMVLYVSLTYGGLNVRPLYGVTGDRDGFLDAIAIGKVRFTYVGELPSDTRAEDRAVWDPEVGAWKP